MIHSFHPHLEGLTLESQICEREKFFFATTTETMGPGRVAMKMGLRFAKGGGVTRRWRRGLSVASTNARVEAVLFDMDGVLVSSDGISRMAARDVLKDLYAIDVDPEEFLAYTGMGEGVFLAGVARSHGVEIDVDRAKAAFFETYLAEYCDGSVDISFPGAVELVKACKDAGLKVAVASAADYIKVEGNLSAGRIDIGLFDAVISADQFVGKLKPNPDIFLAAGEALGVAPAHCVVIEDAIAGIEAARRAGMRVVGVSTTMSVDALLGAEHTPDMVRGEIGEILLDDLVQCSVS